MNSSSGDRLTDRWTVTLDLKDLRYKACVRPSLDLIGSVHKVNDATIYNDLRTFRANDATIEYY